MSAAPPGGYGLQSDVPGGTGRVLGLAAAAVAVVGQLVVGFFTVTAIGLIGMPVWAALLLALVWAAGVFGLVVLLRRRPLVAPAVPIVGALALWGLVAAGGAWLGWSA